MGKYSRLFESSDAFVPVEKPIVGQLYHVSWGRKSGVVGRCMSVNEESKTVEMQTPKTKVPFAHPVKWSELRHTRKNQIKNPH